MKDISQFEVRVCNQASQRLANPISLLAPFSSSRRADFFPISVFYDFSTRSWTSTVETGLKVEKAYAV